MAEHNDSKTSNEQPINPKAEKGMGPMRDGSSQDCPLPSGSNEPQKINPVDRNDPNFMREGFCNPPSGNEDKSSPKR